MIKPIAAGVLVIAVLAVVLLLSMNSVPAVSTTTEQMNAEAAGDWINIELTDVNTGEKFTIADFRGKPVLLETFAVWCPTCRQQQEQIKALHDEVGDSVISVSLDVDPSEDEAKVIEHTGRFGFDWRFAVDTEGFGQKLVDQYGINVVNAPSAPVILICEDHSTRLLDFGVKSKSQLQDELAKGC
ncbi:MAG: TlpA family protein disulfide reductase [Candidatus Aenigmatarchaeota archaeon]|nr:MAG: TlpA family protein disulfide reductase [Candidatus Aenigmarchaeota archaeon]